MRSERFGFVILTLAVFSAASFITSGVIAGDQKVEAQRKNELRTAQVRFAGASAVRPGAYVSPGGYHKLLIDKSNRFAIERAIEGGAIELAEYGSSKLLLVESSPAVAAAASVLEGPDGGASTARDDLNVLLLRSGAIDTTLADAPGRFLAQRDGTEKPQAEDDQTAYRLVQFVGPVKRHWLDELRAAGLDTVAYVPNNGYLVRAESDTAGRIIRLSRAANSRGETFIQWEGALKDGYKIHPQLAASLLGDPQTEQTVAIQIAGSQQNTRRSRRIEDSEIRAAQALSLAAIGGSYRVGNFINLRLRVLAGAVSRLAALPEVVNIEPWTEPQLFDERSDQIIAANLTDDGKQSRAPGYLTWLASKGFSSRFGFAIDVTDTGVDRGSTDPAKLHPDFVDAGGSRLLYARDYTADLDPSDVPGHGTINLSIAGGNNPSSDQAVKDTDGFAFGIGTAPFALLASSKIFQSDGRFGLSEPYTSLLTDGYTDGVRVSSNSWGDAFDEYTIDSQEYDSRVRDAVPSLAGNQELSVCFAAGNSGPGGFVNSLGAAKNVIAVAASESSRPGGPDGCNVKDTDADSALDIAFFSSGGPLHDGRMKPDLAAPGSHITGAASQNPDFDGTGVCGANLGKPFFPAGQTLYTWSSGTSHATPQVSGAVALVRQFFLNRGEEPSAALIKALLLNTTTYMTGTEAGGDLPHARQGWGLIDLNRAFDAVPKFFLNQTNTFTDSGQEFVITGEVKDSSQPFRVTLAWTDAPGLSAFAPWVNDLDLEVVINGQVYRGNNFKGQESQPGGSVDSKNNVEAVWLPAGTLGSFAIRVRASNIAGDGVPGNLDLSDQDFALVVYNGERKEVAVAGLASVALAGGSDSVADPGETVSMRVALTDLSPVALIGAHGTLTSNTTDVTVTAGASDFPNIPPGQSGESTSAFSFLVGQSVPCGAQVKLTLDVTSSNGTSRVPIIIPLGRFQNIQIFADDIEAGDANWTHASAFKKKKKKKKQPLDTWSVSDKLSRSSAHSWFSSDPSILADAHLDSVAIPIPADLKSVQLVFYHTFAFEAFGNALAFDGGTLEISTGGDFEDLGAKMLIGGYNGDIRAGTSNPLAGRPGWVAGKIGLPQQVVVDLSSFAGKTVIIRFRFGSDDTGRGSGWFIDDVTLRGDRVTCVPASQ